MNAALVLQAVLGLASENQMRGNAFCRIASAVDRDGEDECGHGDQG